VCVGVEFLAFNVLLYTNYEQKVISNQCYTPIILKNRVLNKKYTFTICVGRVWIVGGYFLFVKQTFNGLLKVINIKKKFLYITC
jgi:hypothetical protein